MEEIVFRLAPASLWLAILWLAESFAAIPKPGRLQHGFGNLSLAALNGLVLFFTVGGISVWACEASPFAPSSQWKFPHTLACFLALDLFSYGWHRLTHTIPMLWRLHAVHHCDEQMDVTTAGRFHVAELAVGALLRFPLLYGLGVSTGTLLAYETTLVLVSMLHHSSISLGNYDRFLRLIIATPSMHSIHHSRDPKHYGSNFASVFSIWDRLFSTYLRTDALISHGLSGSDKKSFTALLKMPLELDPHRDE